MIRRTLWKAMTALIVLSVAISFVQAAPVMEQVTRRVNPPSPLALPEVDAAPEYMQPQTDGDAPVTVPAKRWILQLTDSPLAQYTGGVVGLRATATSVTGDRRLDVNTPEAQDYIAYLEAEQAEVAAAVQQVVPSASIERTYQVVFNGLAVTLPEADEQAGRWLSRLPGVKMAYRQRAYYPDMYASLPLIDAPTLWGQVGGQSEAGKGIKIASIDTGIYVDNDCFDPTGYTYPPGYPKGDTVWTTEKVIVARAYYRGDDPPTPGDEGVLPGINGSSHGTHTSGSMACVPGTVGQTGNLTYTISGVAPAAYLMSYKVFYPSAGPFSGSAFDAELIAAIEDAVVDGADVVNNSWGEHSSSAFPTALDQAYDAAWDAGMVVVFSAGNSGPYPYTVDHPSDKNILVGASTTDGTIASGFLDVTAPPTVPVTLTQMAMGACLFCPDFSMQTVGPGALADVADVTVGGTNTLCDGETISPTMALSGTIALISRGGCYFSDKLWNAQQAGAIGAIVYNNAGDGLINMSAGSHEADTFTIAGGFVGQTNGEDTVQWVADHPTTAEGQLDFSPRQIGNIPDRLASFTSRGPSIRHMIDPDVVAPGVNIFSAGYGSGTGVARHAGFGAVSGTSMAAPHVSGSAAVLKQLHPGWTPAQIKSALMSTAETNVADYDGSEVGVLDRGAGRIDLGKAGDPGLTFDRPSLSFGEMYAGDSSSMTVNATNVVTAAVSANIVVSKTGTVTHTNMFTVTVNPTALNIAAAGSDSFVVTLEVAPNADLGDYEGQINLVGPDLHIPFWAWVRLPLAANPVLLIDNDLSVLGLPDYTGYYTTALESLCIGYDYYNADLHFASDPMFPDLATLQQYEVVIWYTGDNCYPDGALSVSTPPSEWDQDILSQYLRGGGRLLATGQDLASATGSTDPSGAPTGLYNSFLGANYEQDDIFGGGPGSFPPSPSISGLPGSFATGTVLDLNVPTTPTLLSGAGNQFWVDEISVYGEPPSPDTRPVPAEPFLTAIGGLPQEEGYVGLTRAAELTLEEPEPIFSGRTAYLAFGFEGIRDDTGCTTRPQFMNYLLHYLTAEPAVTVSVSGTVSSPYQLVRLTASPVLTNTSGNTLLLPGLPEAVQYRWDFGDGSPFVVSAGPEAGHVYGRFGVFQARVELVDSYGHKAIGEVVVAVGRQIYMPIVARGYP